MRRGVTLEQRLAVQVVEGPTSVLEAGADQIEQLLINVIRNAVDAALETDGCARAGWDHQDRALEVWIEDEGPGLQNTSNLFVRFFTTKTGGSGVGLALCRQIADGHGGSLTVENGADRPGARAVLRLPV